MIGATPLHGNAHFSDWFQGKTTGNSLRILGNPENHGFLQIFSPTLPLRPKKDYKLWHKSGTEPAKWGNQYDIEKNKWYLFIETGHAFFGGYCNTISPLLGRYQSETLGGWFNSL